MKSIIKLKHYVELTSHKHDIVLKDKLEDVWKDTVKIGALLDTIKVDLSPVNKALVDVFTKDMFYDEP